MPSNHDLPSGERRSEDEADDENVADIARDFRPFFTFKFEHGEHSGESYQVWIRACSNPVCNCCEVELLIESIDGESSSGATRLPRYVFSLDLSSKSYRFADPRKVTPIEENFARSFLAEFGPEQWDLVHSAFAGCKAEAIAHLDPDKIDGAILAPLFAVPHTVFAWTEIFPFDRELSVEDGDQLYFIDDQYCLNPLCPCEHAYLRFIPIDSAQGVQKTVAFTIVYHYLTDTHVIDDPPSDRSIPAEKLFRMFRKSESDLGKKIRNRHRTLRKLYRRFGPKEPTAGSAPMFSDLADSLEIDLPVAIAGRPASSSFAKVGRNEPCPCGSGKKYKLCCGR